MDDDAARRRRAAAGDCLRQRREPDAGAGDSAREIGIRAALGAGRWRLIRGLLIEGVVLSTAGAIIGLGLAYAGVQLIKAWLPAGLPRGAAIAIDLRVLAAASLAAVVSGILFGIVPALLSSRPDLVSALKDSTRSTTRVAGQRLRNALVVAEVALAVVLLVGAGLFAGSFVQLLRIDPGFDHRNVLVFNVGLPATAGLKFGTPAYDDLQKRSRAYVNQVVDRVKQLPGVSAAAAVQGGLPLTGNWSRTRIELPGVGELKGDDDSLDFRTVTPEYLQTMRIPLKKGRYLAATDTESSESVAVINEAAARKYWSGQEALGQRFKANGRDRVVVGVVGDIRHLGPEMPPRQECYVTYAQNNTGGGIVVARTAGNPLSVLPAAKSVVWAINPEQRFTGRVFSLAAAVLTGTGLLASSIPARRAARVDPLVPLREE